MLIVRKNGVVSMCRWFNSSVHLNRKSNHVCYTMCVSASVTGEMFKEHGDNRTKDDSQLVEQISRLYSYKIGIIGLRLKHKSDCYELFA